MERHVVSGPDMPPQLGPYSHAVTAGGFVHVAGQAGMDPATGSPAGAGFGEQARQAFANLEVVLRAAGSRPDLVVSTTVLMASVEDFPALNEAFGEFFPSGPPTRMTMQVPLPLGLLISIGCVAVVAD